MTKLNKKVNIFMIKMKLISNKISPKIKMNLKITWISLVKKHI